MQVWMLLVVGGAFCLSGEDVLEWLDVAAALVNHWGDSVIASSGVRKKDWRCCEESLVVLFNSQAPADR